MNDPVAAARERVLADHRTIIEEILAAADAVADAWPERVNDRPATTDRDAVVPPLREQLTDRQVLDRLPAVLRTAVTAAGDDLPAEPVAAPPYVVVTSTGPVLRATAKSGRIVVAVEVFEVHRNDPTCYVRAGEDPETVLSVSRL